MSWDFHTASESSLLSKLTDIYNSTLTVMNEEIDEGGQGYYAIKAVDSTSKCTDSSSLVGRSIYYKIKVPWYLHNTSRTENALRLDLFGLNGAAVSNIPLHDDAGIRIIVPCSIYTGKKKPFALVQFGHGIFGSKSELDSTWLMREAHANGWILWAMDWRGFSFADLPLAAKLLLYDSDSSSTTLQAAVVQGFSNKLAGKIVIKNIISRERSNLGIKVFFAKVIV